MHPSRHPLARLRSVQLALVASACVGLLAPGLAVAGEPVDLASIATPSAPDDYGYGRRTTAPPRPTLDLRARATADAAAPRRARPDWLEPERVGAPYEAKGRWYVPTPEPGYAETGLASWYGAEFAARPTATGETFDPEALSAAHPTLPIPSLVQVTNLATGREVILRVNDRGPFKEGRIIDLSRRAADVLGFEQAGEAKVHVRYLGPAPKRPDFAKATPARPLVSEATPPAPKALPTPPPVRQANAADAYVVQIGAYAAMANAERARGQVARAGSVSVEARPSRAGPVYRVRIGPFSERDAAEAARVQVASLGFAEALVAPAD